MQPAPRYTPLRLTAFHCPSGDQALNLRAAMQSMVLLYNNAAGAAPVLPLKPGKHIAVIGPHAKAQRSLIQVPSPPPPLWASPTSRLMIMIRWTAVQCAMSVATSTAWRLPSLP